MSIADNTTLFGVTRPPNKAGWPWRIDNISSGMSRFVML
jgi:hypothetical protein